MNANVRYQAMMILACLLVVESMQGQSDLIPVIVSPLIGDTLDREEYEYYRFRIKPEVLKDFHHARFLMAPDGMLTIKVTCTFREGNTIDSLIPTHLTRSMVESGLRLALQENKEGRDWGRQVTVFPARGGELEGELLAVDGEGIVLSMTDEATDSDLAGGVAASRRFPLDQIRLVVIDGESWAFRGALIGTLSGAVIGYGIGKIADPSTTSYGAGIGVAAGAGVGLLTGVIIGAVSSEPDQKYAVLEEDAVARLQPSARFPRKIPPFIRRIPAVEYDGSLDSLNSIKSH